MGDDGQPLRLGEYLDQWLRRREHQLRPSTHKHYASVIANYLRPHLGGRRLDELDRERLGRLSVWLPASGGEGGRRLRVGTVGHAHMVLRQALQDAVVDGLLAANPARHARLPRHDPQATELDEEPEVWTPQQAKPFLAFVEDHPWRALWHRALGTGACRGELQGLRWRGGRYDSLAGCFACLDLPATPAAPSRRFGIGAGVGERSNVPMSRSDVRVGTCVPARV